MSFWDAAYRSGDVNWDPGPYDGHLPGLLEDFSVKPCAAIDLGCGTGKSAVWLAGRGFDVTGVDVSPAAIETAISNARSAGVSCLFLAGSYPRDFPDSVLAPKGYGFVIERGFVQHYHGSRELDSILSRTAGLLRGDGLFYSLIATREGARGYGWLHRWSEREIRETFETHFTIAELRPSVFTFGEKGSIPAWVTVMRALQ